MVVHHSAYGYVEVTQGEHHECDTSMIYFIHRRGCLPSLSVVTSKPAFHALGMNPSDSIMRHYLPDSSWVLMDSVLPWRGALQCSPSFISCFVELMYPPRGLCLEFGCGIVPLLATCLSRSCMCLLDSDEDLISTYVMPLLRPRADGHEKASTSTNVVNAREGHMGGNPFDHL
ncbi:hypothetical protein L7F22_009693 [Adiantum nelumboides]|nr:hypothetical protein [Adiantum nelumboides]MCO5556149.1 hypothetical protein [Adiantum nelumboides]